MVDKSRDPDTDRAIKAKIEQAADVQTSKNQRLKALQKRLMEKGITLRDEDIRVVNVELKMPVSGFLFGQALIKVGGAAVPDRAHIDFDPSDPMRHDDDPRFPVDKDTPPEGDLK